MVYGFTVSDGFACVGDRFFDNDVINDQFGDLEREQNWDTVVHQSGKCAGKLREKVQTGRVPDDGSVHLPSVPDHTSFS